MPARTIKITATQAGSNGGCKHSGKLAVAEGSHLAMEATQSGTTQGQLKVTVTGGGTPTLVSDGPGNWLLKF